MALLNSKIPFKFYLLTKAVKIDIISFLIIGRAMKKEIIAEVERLLNIVNLPMIECRFTLRSFTAGTFCVREGGKQLYFNFNLKLAETNPEYIERTVVHEVAHYVNYMRGSGSAHDSAWKKVMIELGAKDTSLYHTYDISAVGVAYMCPNHGIRYLSKIQHNNIVRGKYTHYNCSKCKEKLVKCK